MPTSGAVSAADTSIQFRLVHSVRGRTRMRVTPPHLANDLARTFERLLRDQPGVRQVRGNVASGSVVVTYDPDVLQVDRLFAPLPEQAASSWLNDQLARIREILASWTRPLRDARDSVLDRLDALWNLRSAGQDQMNAAMSFWRATSVVALSRRLLQAGRPDAAGEAGADSRR